MRVVIALDSFKGSASAQQAADAVATGWRSVAPGTRLEIVPLADGGEGTIEALAVAPDARTHRIDVTGPDGRLTSAQWLELGASQRIGVVELAQSSGITLMNQLAPLDAHTVGMGEVISQALDGAVDQLLIAVGGSASTDGGAGALAALGARFLDEQGEPVDMGARGLSRLAVIDPSELRRPPAGGVTVLTDVVNPLTGPLGAAAVYGPQKGASERDVQVMDDALGHFAQIATRDLVAWSGAECPSPHAPGSGAAGGAAYGLALWGATLVPGAVAIADAAGLDAALAGADLVVTGEGRVDSQTAQGKVVSEVAKRARNAGVPCALVAGLIEAPVTDFVHSFALATLAGSARSSIADPLRWLVAAGAELAQVSTNLE